MSLPGTQKPTPVATVTASAARMAAKWRYNALILDEDDDDSVAYASWRNVIALSHELE